MTTSQKEKTYYFNNYMDCSECLGLGITIVGEWDFKNIKPVKKYHDVSYKFVNSLCTQHTHLTK